MANYRLKISNFIPNSWLSKNKMTKKQPPSSSATNPHNHDQPVADQRKSYHFTRDLSVDTHKEDSPPKKNRSPDRPRKSTKKRRPLTNKKPVHQLVSVWTGSNSSDTEFQSPELPISSRDSLSCSCNTTSSYDEVYGKVDLPPIITKPVKKVVVGSDTHTRSPVKRYPGGKVKGNSYSPRVGNRVRVQGINGGRRSYEYRRSLSESMAVVKTSVDPGRDFKESMVEMIMENNMKSSKDLEDLLACYLSLNSDEYHDLIIKVFKQIWFECTNIRL